MNETSWAKLGLTDEVLAQLYEAGRKYAARRIGVEHREDAVQEAMCRVLRVVLCPPESYPNDPEERLKYLCKTLCNEITSHRLPQDTNIPID